MTTTVNGSRVALTSRRMTAVAVVVAAASLAAAGCSSSGATSSAASGSTAAGSSTASGSTTAAQSSCLAAAHSVVSKGTAPLALPAASPTIPVSKLAGKTVWFVSINSTVTIGADTLAGFKAAAAAAHVKVISINGNQSLGTSLQGLTQAVAAKPDGIVTWAINTAEATVQLKQAQANKTPVVGVYEAGPLTSAGVLSQAGLTGQQEAAAALIATNCRLVATDLYGIGLATQQAQAQAIDAYIKQTCPTTCSVRDQLFDESTEATSLQGIVTNLLSRYPTTNAIFTGSDDQVPFMVPAIRSVGSKVRVVSGGGLPQELQYTEQGVQIADDATPPGQFVGWQIFDQLARVMLGMPPSAYDSTMPVKLFTAQNLKGVNVNSPFPELNGYQAAFTASWGL
jgi:ABC-type sugar transport system substrate-binding protein